MSKIRPGNKWNSYLNGEWAAHVRGDWKKVTSKARRNWDKKVIKEELELPELPSKPHKRTKNWVIEYNHDGVWKRWFGRFAKKEDAIKSALKQTTWELSMIGLGLRYRMRKNYRVRNLETDEDFYL